MGRPVIYKLGLCLLLFSTFAFADSALDQAVLETKISDTEMKLKAVSGNSLNDIAKRSNLENDLLALKQEKGRRLLKLAIEGTDTSAMNLNLPSISHRFQDRTSDFGAGLNEVMDNTITKSNPAIAGKKPVSGRPLVLYRDVEPEDVFMAKNQKGEFVVYKSKDLRGRTVYKDLNGNVTEAVIQRKLFPKEEVVIMDEKGNLVKGTPKAIYADGTLEIKDQNGFTTRRPSGTYHLTDEIQSIKNNKVVMHSQNPESAYTAKEKKALEALKKALCGL